MPNSCALDMADEGKSTLEEVSNALTLTRQRVEQIEKNALSKVAKAMIEENL